MSDQLGRLEKVALRDVWTRESEEFTPWLAQEGNLVLLGKAIGVDLELEAQEKDVGRFRADLLCKDTATGAWVLVENQLGRTDHVHLGQLLTYASGLKAVSIVWLAARFTDEHRAALDWLNEITGDRFRFFGLEVELWRIGSSAIAPKFNIVSEPNDWSRDVAAGASRVAEGELSDTKRLQLRFWTTFREFVQEQETAIRPTKARPQHWMAMGIGRSGFGLSAVVSSYDSESGNYESQELRTELVLHSQHAKRHFERLVAGRSQIEDEIGASLTWHNPDTANMCRIFLRKTVVLGTEDTWEEHHRWLLEKLETMRAVFAPRVRLL